MLTDVKRPVVARLTSDPESLGWQWICILENDESGEMYDEGEANSWEGIMGWVVNSGADIIEVRAGDSYYRLEKVNEESDE